MSMPLAYFLAPIPPTRARRALFPAGRGGGLKVILCKGLRPLHPRGWGDAALARPAVPVPGGGLCLLRGGVEVAFQYPAGGLPSLSPANPAFSFVLAPYPPDPLPRWGRGCLFSLFCRGLRPRHPGIRPPAALTEPAVQVSGGTTRRESIPVVFAANHGFKPRGCKGRSPLHKKTKKLPLPRRGRGQGG